MLTKQLTVTATLNFKVEAATAPNPEGLALQVMDEYGDRVDYADTMYEAIVIAEGLVADCLGYNPAKIRSVATR